MSSIDFDILNNIVCLVAKRKSGKSQLLRYIITKNKHKFDKMFELKVVFDTLEELQDFLNDHSEKEAIIDKIKKPDDRRGQGTKAFHEKAKRYRTEHPF